MWRGGGGLGERRLGKEEEEEKREKKPAEEKGLGATWGGDEETRLRMDGGIARGKGQMVGFLLD